MPHLGLNLLTPQTSDRCDGEIGFICDTLLPVLNQAVYYHISLEDPRGSVGGLKVPRDYN